MLRPRIAAPAKPDAPPHALQVLEGVNDECHTWRGRLDKHGGLVLSSPRVFAVYWDPFFADSANVARMDQFFRDIGKTVWFQGQRQFGVRPPLTLVGSVVIGTPAPTKMSRDQLKDFLVARLDDGTIGVKPAGRETSLLYVLITPGATELTLERPFKKPLSSLTDFSGYHDWDRYAISPVFTTENLFFAAIPMPSAPGLTLKLVADVLTPTLCHEMVESFTDRNGDGWTAPNGCEIGDVCEVQAADRLGHWRIERYWSDADQVCFPVVHFPPYRDFLLHTGTPIVAADGAANFHWAVGDFNGDGVPDLFGIKVSNTGSGTVEVHVLDGASGYQSFLLQTGTPIGAADGAAHFVWGVGSFNGDGVADLFGIKTSGTGTGMVEVHVLDGASGYQQFLLQKPTKVNQGEAQKFRMVVAPLNQGGIADVFALQVLGAPSGKLRVRVLDDLDDFQTPALEVGTPIDAADAAANFSWAVGDVDGDGVADLYAVKTSGSGTGTVEVHVLGGVGAARIPTSRVFPAGDPFGYAAQVPRVVYRGTDGHVYELAIYPETGGWGLFDMSGATGAPPAAGDPMGYLSNTARVVYRAGDGHVHEIWLGGNGWEHFDMTAATGAPPAAGDPFGYYAQVPRVVYRGTDGHVWELAIYPESGNWGAFDMTAATGPPAAAGNPMGYTGQVPRVVYRGTDGHVWELAIYPETGSWGAFDMTAATGAPSIAGDPFGYMTQVPRVVYRGTNGHVYELAIYPETGGWGAFDMTAATGAPVAAGEPRGYQSNTARVVYRGGDGHVHEIWLGGNGWEHFDMTDATKAPAPAGNPMGYHLDTPRVVYRSAIGPVFELAIDGGSWRRLEL